MFLCHLRLLLSVWFFLCPLSLHFLYWDLCLEGICQIVQQSNSCPTLYLLQVISPEGLKLLGNSEEINTEESPCDLSVLKLSEIS